MKLTSILSVAFVALAVFVANSVATTTPASASMTCFCKVSVVNIEGQCHPANSDVLLDLTSNVNTTYSWPRNNTKWQDCQQKCADALTNNKDQVCAAASAAGIAPGTVITAYGALGNCGHKGEYDTAGTLICPAPVVPPPPPESCCPPWNKTTLQDMMYFVFSTTDNTQYAVKFQPTQMFAKSMQAYVNYLNTVSITNPPPAPGDIQKITIAWEIFDLGTGPKPSLTNNGCPSPFPSAGARIGPVQYTNWVTQWVPEPPPPAIPPNNTNIGPSTMNGVANVFPNAPPLLVNHWYAVHTWINASNNKWPNPETSYEYFDEGCKNACYVFGMIVGKVGKPQLTVIDSHNQAKVVPMKTLRRD